MKQIILKLRKCLCLTLSIFLLASNMQVFAQEIPYFDILMHYSNEFPIKLNEFENSLSTMSTELRHIEFVERINPTFIEILNRYKKIRGDYYKYIDIFNTITKKEVLTDLSSKYTDVPFIRYITVEEMFSNPLPVDKIEEAIKYMEDRIKEMREGIKNIERAKAELIKKEYTSLDILEHAYKNGMLPKEKAGIKLTLEAMDADVSVTSLVKNIRKYLTDFGTKIKDVKYYPTASLTRELKGMTLAERAKYVDELTELKSGSKTFISDFKKLDRPSKRYVGKSITKGMWELPLIGAIITAAIITEITADNNFNPAYTASIKDISEMKNKIENGEATLQEQWLFYTDERNESLIQKDAVHTLHFVKLASMVYAEEQVIIEEEKETNNKIETTFIKKYNNSKERIVKDLKAGSL